MRHYLVPGRIDGVRPQGVVMKSSNLAYRMDCEAEETTEPLASAMPTGEWSARAQVEARAAARRARQRVSFEYRAILIRDQGFRPFRVVN
jgi:hypothetical protein